MSVLWFSVDEATSFTYDDGLPCFVDYEPPVSIIDRNNVEQNLREAFSKGRFMNCEGKVYYVPPRLEPLLTKEVMMERYRGTGYE